MPPIRIVSILLVVGALGLLPFSRFALFPGWSGLNRVAESTWMEATAGDPADFVMDLVWAETKIESWWGDVPDRPRIIVCGSLKCDTALGGPGPYAQTYGRYLMIVHSRLGQESQALRRAIFVHELSHIVLASRLSLWDMWQGRVPAWLNEGIAVLASDDPRFSLTPILCESLRDEPLPETMRAWGHMAGQRERPIYQAAGCRAKEWLENNALSDI